MKEIKFRAWDNEYNEMLYLGRSDLSFDYENGQVMAFSVNGYDEFYYHECYENRKPNWILEQSTGLKDKNGKEIYEGDIVNYYEKKSKHIEYIQWDSFCCKFVTTGRDKKSHDLYKSDEDCYEIIGNIHENKELLTS